MARYYFHLRDGADVLIDPEGCEVEPVAIVSEALMQARAIISHEAIAGRISLGQYIDVWDGAGHIVHTLSFDDAVDIVGPSRQDIGGR